MNMQEERQVLKIPANSIQPHQSTEGEKTVLRVAAYCRVSTERESQTNSYVRQITYYKEKIEKREDWTLVGIYADEGVSGTGKKKRDGFLKLIRDCEVGKIDLVLTKSISRFARNTVDLLTTIRDLKSKNIAVYFEKENINTLDSNSEILITILSSQAQEESRNTSENTRWSIRQKFGKGELMINHNHFMGYSKDANGQLEIIPQEAETVREIFRLYLAGYSSLYIANWLEQHGKRTVMGKTKWHGTVIDKMLSNEKYMGDALLQKTYTVDFLTKQRAKNKGTLPKFFVKENHPPIVSKETFYCVQQEKLRRIYFKSQEKGRPSIYPITSKLICSDCGEHFSRVTRTKGEKAVVWRCRSRIRYKDKYCKKVWTILEKDLHGAIWGAYSLFAYTMVTSENSVPKEMWDIANQMAECKKAILEAIKENVQGFLEWEELVLYCTKLRKEYYDLADGMLQLFLKCGESCFIPCAFTPTEVHLNYKRYEDELVGFYVERMWVTSQHEIVVLFQNGSMVRKRYYY